MIKIIIFSCLFWGFYQLFSQWQMLDRICSLLKKTPAEMDMTARQKILENKSQLLKLREHHALWFLLERWLYYSGIRLRFPGISAEFLMSGNLAVIGLIFLFSVFFGGIGEMLIIAAVFMAAEVILLRYLRAGNLRTVNENLIMMLNFMGNYNITAAEITGVFNHVSRYMAEPIRTVLEECYLETLATGDAGKAILSMAEKIEHPQFKELARNIEIGIRYCADFTVLINVSRRSMREYLRITQKRKAMLREAAVNMLLLTAISFTVFLLFWVQLQRVYG